MNYVEKCCRTKGTLSKDSEEEHASENDLLQEPEYLGNCVASLTEKR